MSLRGRSSRSEDGLASCARLDSRGRLSLREKILGLNFCTFCTGGDSMKRATVILGTVTLGIISVAVWAEAQTSGKPAQQNPPAAGQAAPAQGATPGAAAAAAGTRPRAA